MDADKLDGLNSGSFLRSDATDTASGTLTFNGVCNIRNAIDLGDNNVLRFGSGDDFEMFCNGSHMYMDLNSGIGNLYIRDGTTTRFTFDDNGSFTCTNNITASSTITGNTLTCATLNVDTTANFGDAILNFDNSNAKYDTAAEVPVNGCKIFGGKDQGTSFTTPSNLNLGTWYGVSIVPTIDNQTIPRGQSAWICNARDGSTRQQGSSYQASLYPNSDNTGEVGNSSATWNNGQFTNLTIDGTLTVRAAIDLADNDILRFGSSDDCELFTNGTHMYMDLNSGIGNFYIRDGTTTRYTFDDNGEFTATGSIITNSTLDVRGFALKLGKGDQSSRGDSGESRAMVKEAGAVLTINYAGDFGGGVKVSSDLTATGNVTAYSDARLKENIEVIPDALNKVDQLRGVTFTRKDTDDNERHVGVIAQEVEEVLPEAVSEMNGTKTVAYGNMVGLLIEAIKELKQEIKELKEERN